MTTSRRGARPFGDVTWPKYHTTKHTQVTAETLDDYRNRVRRRLIALRDKAAALPPGVAAQLCIVCVRRSRAQPEDVFAKMHGKLADEFDKGDNAVVRMDTPVEHMASSAGSRDWEAVKKRLEACFSAAFVQRLAAYDSEVRSLHRSSADVYRREARPVTLHSKPFVTEIVYVDVAAHYGIPYNMPQTWRGAQGRSRRMQTETDSDSST